MKRYLGFFKENPVWARILLFSLTLFFMKIVDGAISFWAPVQIQATLNNEILMGLIISSQSVMGFLADLIFPNLLKTFKTKSLIIFGFVSMLLTILILTGSVIWPFLAIFEVTMLGWAVYFELFSFGSYQFISTHVPLSMRSGAWGVADVFRNLGLFFGPLIAAWFLPTNYLILDGVLILFIILGYSIFTFSDKDKELTDQVDTSHLDPRKEFTHWITLAKSVWPAITITFLLTIIDATFWTIGAIWTISLVKQNPLGAFILPAYILPSLFLGLILAKWEVFKGKKILAEKMIIGIGFFLIVLAFNSSVYWILFAILISSSFSALAYPLLDGVYSDLIERMGHEKKDMIGLTSSIVNLGYIIWSPIAGLLASQIGERMTFSYLGLLAILVAIGLLLTTPKKLRLPQAEIKSWEH